MLIIGIPVHNEATTIGVLLWRLRTVLADVSREYEVVVYDDASTDGTVDTLTPYMRVLPLTVLRGKQRVGHAGATEALIRHASRTTKYPKRDGLLLMQGDFTDAPEFVPEFLRRFEGGADLVIGERRIPADAPTAVRRLHAAARWVLRPLVGIRGVQDLTTGYCLARITVLRDALRAMGDAPLAAGDGWIANAELLLAAAPHARRIETIPVIANYGTRARSTRRRAWGDALALAGWGWSKRGTRIAANVVARDAIERPRSSDAEILRAEDTDVHLTELPDSRRARRVEDDGRNARRGRGRDRERGERDRGERGAQDRDRRAKSRDEGSERRERTERPDRAERPERPERTERPARPEREKRRERPARGPRPEREQPPQEVAAEATEPPVEEATQAPEASGDASAEGPRRRKRTRRGGRNRRRREGASAEGGAEEPLIDGSPAESNAFDAGEDSDGGEGADGSDAGPDGASDGASDGDAARRRRNRRGRRGGRRRRRPGSGDSGSDGRRSSSDDGGFDGGDAPSGGAPPSPDTQTD